MTGNTATTNENLPIALGTDWPDGCKLTLTGMTFPSHRLPFGQWSMVLNDLVNCYDVCGQMLCAIKFGIGKALRYGEFHYGEKYAQAVDALDKRYSASSLANMQWVENAIEEERRLINAKHVRFEHYAEVAALPPSDQERLLARAEKEKLSTKQLRDLRHDTQAKNDGEDKDEARAVRYLKLARDNLRLVVEKRRFPLVCEHLLAPLGLRDGEAGDVQ